MAINLTVAQKKILSFALFGAAGCFLAALLGEVWMKLTFKPPKKQPLAVCMVLDCSGSMNGAKLVEVKTAAKNFVNRNRDGGDEMGVVGFGSRATIAAPLTADHSSLDSAIQSLSDGGGTNMSEALRTGLSELTGTENTTHILLFTDGMPNSQPDTLTAAQDCRSQGITIVAVATPDADQSFLGQLTGDPALVILVNVGNFESAFKQAEEKIFGRQLADSKKTRSGVGYSVIRIGVWTALLAIGISLALIIGQNHYLQRTLLNPNAALTGATRGLAAGLIAGALSQLVFSATASASTIVVEIGRIFGWAMLGGLLGLGLAMFVDNLKPSRGMAGGAIGGAAGAIGFIITGLIASDIIGRPVGAAILGFFIGAMIALVDAFFREAWVEVHYGPNEMRTVALGSKPVVIGSNRELCTIMANGAPAVALRYLLDEGRISCEDVQASSTVEVTPGDRRSTGNIEIVVCAAAAVSRSPGVSPVAVPPRTPAEHEAVPPASPTAKADYYLCIRGRRLPLSIGIRLDTNDVSGLETTERDGAVAEVTAHPKKPELLGLRNLSSRPWKVTMPDGTVKDVAPSQNMRLAAGVAVEFGVLKGTIE